MSYETYQPSILPAWLQGTNGDNYAATLGALKDDLSNASRAAATAGMPQASRPDCLGAIAFERQLVRGAAETDAQYAERLRTAWDAWSFSGTPLGLLLQLEALYPGIPIWIVQQACRAFTLNPDTTLAPRDRLVIVSMPSGWTFDANSGLPPTEGFWSRFAVIFPGPLPAGWIGAVSPPTDLTTPSKAEVNGIIRLINQWRPAKATCVYWEIITSGVVWGFPPTLDWGASGITWGFSSVVRFNGQTEY